jgi:aerobic carbon-monoxide dehydrogenase medium subunit
MSGFRYERPGTVAEATALLAKAGGGAKILAGGTDLMIALRGGPQPTVLVDIKRIPELGSVRWTSAGDLEIGACVRVQDVAEDARIREVFTALAEGAEAIGSLQIRWRATVAGNLSNASPCMDTAPPLLVLNGRLRVTGPRGTREAPLSDFFLGVKKTALAPEELVTAVIVPKPAAGLTSAFDKVKRSYGHDLAIVNSAAAWDRAAGTLRVAIGSCAVRPALVPALADVGPKSDPKEVGERLAALAQEHILPIDDVRASAEYRREMTAVLCRRLVRRLLGAGRTS